MCVGLVVPHSLPVYSLHNSVHFHKTLKSGDRLAEGTVLLGEFPLFKHLEMVMSHHGHVMGVKFPWDQVDCLYNAIIHVHGWLVCNVCV